ncbi:MAG TPA: MarR family winged helix-turn-helix transcriptional regulator [Vicinamibacterales bacterium]|nr:MarR family winged helix-turn-helix transcriptional regulator [Vicinamibacterales bacterium]
MAEAKGPAAGTSGAGNGPAAGRRRRARAGAPRGQTAEAVIFGALPPLLSERPAYLLWRIAFRSRELLDRALEPLGIRARTFGLLAFLAHVGPVSQQALGQYAGVDASTMVALIDDLEALGVAERRRDPRDRRAYLLQITQAGRRLLETAGRLTGDIEPELLTPLSPAEQRRLVTLLKKLSDWDGAGQGGARGARR